MSTLVVQNLEGVEVFTVSGTPVDPQKVELIDDIYVQSNAGFTQANVALAQANLAFDRANTINIQSDSTSATRYIAFSDIASGFTSSLKSSANLAFNPSTSELSVGSINLLTSGTNPLTATMQSQSNFSAGIAMRKRGNTADPEGAVATNAELGYHGFFGWDGAAYNRGAFLIARATENWNTTARGTRLAFHTTTNGATTNAERMTVDPAGNVLIGRTTSTVGQNVKLDVAGAANTSDILVNGVSASPLGQQTIWIPAAGMYARTSNGAASGTVETATNKVMIRTLDFDTTAQEFAQFAVQMPKSWNEGTLICQFVWSHGATTTNFGVVWAIEAVSFADAEALDAAFGTAAQVADTGGTANAIYITSETSALTVAGSPTAEEYVVFQVKRVPADASDTMAIDARLHGVKIHYTIDAAKDD